MGQPVGWRGMAEAGVSRIIDHPRHRSISPQTAVSFLH